MALTDHNILITPSRGSSSDPTIAFTGADASNSATITLRVLNSATTGILSFEGSSGQLFSIVDDLSGVIFSVNDISGLPSIEVLDTGEIRLAQYSGYVNVLSSTAASSTTTGALVVKGGTGIGQDLYVGGTIYGNIVGSITGFSSTASSITTIQRISSSDHFLTFVDSNNTAATPETLYTTSSLKLIPSSGNVLIGGGSDNGIDRLQINGIVSMNGLKQIQQTISVSTTTNLNLSESNNFYMTLDKNVTFTLSNVSDNIGASGYVIMQQNATGGWYFTLPSEMKTPNGRTISQVTGSNTLSLITYYVITTNTIVINYIGNFS